MTLATLVDCCNKIGNQFSKSVFKINFLFLICFINFLGVT